jgi:Putative adhesin
MKIASGPKWVPQRLLPAGVLAVALAAGCSVSTGGSSSSSPAGSAGSSGQAAGRSYSLPAGLHTLKVNNRVGTIRVTASSGSSRVQVTEQPGNGPTASHKVSGSTGTLSASCSGPTDCHMDYQVKMPSNVALDVTGAVGKVALQGGPTKADISTDAGQVTGSGLARGSYTVNTKAGTVNLKFASAPSLVKVGTTAGAIDVTVPGSSSYRVKADSDVGTSDVSVHNNAQAANKIDLHATFGHISLNKG